VRMRTWHTTTGTGLTWQPADCSTVGALVALKPEKHEWLCRMAFFCK
jgi:hypothetical protein